MDKQDIIIYKTPDGRASVALYARDGNIWFSQNQLAELFATSRPNITMYISNILKDNELPENSVCKDFLTTEKNTKNLIHAAKNMMRNSQISTMRKN